MNGCKIGHSSESTTKEPFFSLKPISNFSFFWTYLTDKRALLLYPVIGPKIGDRKFSVSMLPKCFKFCSYPSEIPKEEAREFMRIPVEEEEDV